MAMHLAFLGLKEAFVLMKSTLTVNLSHKSVSQGDSKIQQKHIISFSSLPAVNAGEGLADLFPYLIFWSRHMVPEGGTMGKLAHLFSHNCTIVKCPSPFSKLIKSSTATTFLIYRGRP